MDLISRIKALDLPVGQYIVFGSSVMEMHGIRKAKDIDVVVTQVLYTELKNRGCQSSYCVTLIVMVVKPGPLMVTGAADHEQLEGIVPSAFFKQPLKNTALKVVG